MAEFSASTLITALDSTEELLLPRSGDLATPLRGSLQSLVLGGAKAKRVGNGQLHQTVQSAIDAITDSAFDNPYLITVEPGYDYGSFTTGNKTDITIVGAYRATQFSVGSGIGIIDLSGVRNSLWNVQVNYNEDSNAPGTEISAVDTALGQSSEIIIGNCYFDIDMPWASRTVPVWAIGTNQFRGSGENWGIKVYNSTIYTESCGIKPGWASGEYYNTHIQMIGGAVPTGIDHVGFKSEQLGREYLFNTRLTTDYTSPNIDDPGANLYGIWCAHTGGNSNNRINVKGIEGIIRNDNASAGNTSYIKMDPSVDENVECRLEGFHGQCEGQGVLNLIETDYSYSGGSIVPGRVILIDKQFNSNCPNSNITGMRFFIDDTWDTAAIHARDIKPGGLWYCDSTGGAFGLIFPEINQQLTSPIVIVNGPAGNNITLTTAGSSTFTTVGGAIGASSLVIATDTQITITNHPDGGNNYLVY